MARKLNHPKATTAWRVWSRVDFAGPNTLRKGAPGRCWVWTGPTNGVGYGRVTINGRLHYPHRAAYEMTTAPIPAGLQIDHRCRTRSCLNPAHLEPVTGSENVRRSTAADAARMRAALVTHCPEGHKYDSANTYEGSHGRRCRACSRDRYRERYASDPEFREQQQTAARERMRARRAPQQTNPERTAA
jgi:hypothetical protein